MPDLLIELLSEEIPARMQAKAADDFRKLMTDGLVEAGLTYAHAGAFVTPRRLALAVEGLAEASRAVREERKGPATSAPEAALQGFLRSTGLTLDQLERRQDKKGETFFAVIERPGREAAGIVAEVLEKTIREFPWPKSMRWGSGSLRWVRPLQGVLAILVREDGAEVVPFEIEGIVAGNATRGHRFHAPSAFSVSSFDDYAEKLKRAHVVLSPQERRDRIRHDAGTLAFAQGMEVVEDEGLLAEVAGLVEWPVTLMGRIEEEFLVLPPEVLKTSMKEHQKFFSVRNPATGRIEGFCTVANAETADRGATILAGNAKVLRARLSDARFFWENDLRVARAGMGEWKEGLKSVTFHNKLGSQADRVERIAALAREIAPFVGADPEIAAKAAEVAKLDLRSAMVGEFPELQGLMGRYYASAAGLPEEVAAAAEEHYSPLGPADEVPTAPVSVAVALADKIDTLTGFWAIDEKPTGSKDPFALRRAALGVIRLLLRNQIRLPLFDIFALGFDRHTIADLKDYLLRLQQETQRAAQLFRITPEELEEAIKSIDQDHGDEDERRARREKAYRRLRIELIASLSHFLDERLKVHFRDQNIHNDVIDACLAMPGNDDLVLLVRRAEALGAFLGTEDGKDLVQLFKRANNILSQAEARDGVEYSFGADPKFAEGAQERAVFAALDAAEPRITAAMAAEDFSGAMGALAGLRAPIDAFFEAVQVNSESQVLRRNRLNLLHRIRALCLAVADLAKLGG